MEKHSSTGLRLLGAITILSSVAEEASALSEDDEGNIIKVTHWSEVTSEMSFSLGRKLTSEEISVVSLAMNYGPTPILDLGEKKDLSKLLFPERNVERDVKSWEELVNVIAEYYNIEE